MKTAFLPIVFLLSLAISCKKSDENLTVLEGRWELTSVTSGMNGKPVEYTTNNGNIVVFSGSNYQTFSNHALIKAGTFKVIKEMSILRNINSKRIIYDNELNQLRTFFNIDGETLECYVDAFDGPIALYIRK